MATIAATATSCTDDNQ
ncbi:Vmc-like lipoprotein signal peptide domain-containing protein [Ectobacillus panaciterrae]